MVESSWIPAFAGMTGMRSGVATARMKNRENRKAHPHAYEAPPVCELCLRESERFTEHHLVPRSRGGKHGPKARLCPTCHRQLHAMFSEKTLANELNSVERLRADPEFAAYLKWASKQKDGAAFRVRRANARR